MAELSPLGIYEKALRPGTIPALLEQADLLEFDFIEMSVDPSPERLERLEWTSAERRALLKEACNSRARVRSICLSANRRFPLGHSESAVRQRGMTILRSAIRLAADLRIPVVQVAGYDTYGEASTSDTISRYIDALADGAELARSADVMLGIENQEEGYVESAARARSVVERISSPYLNIYLDLGNAVVNGFDVAAELRRAARYLVGLHIKDARRGEPRRVPFGKGAVDFRMAFRTLGDIKFSGPAMIEMWNDDPARAEADAASARKWILEEWHHAQGAIPQKSSTDSESNRRRHGTAQV